MTPRPSLASDDRGAVMVLGLVMAVFLVGMLYYVVGVGETIRYRERLQDASDAGAFAAAAVHARGMNLLVLINMVMAALLAILVGLRLVQTVLLGLILLCFGLSFWTAGQSTQPIPYLRKAHESAKNVYKQAKPTIEEALGALNCASQALKVAMPVAAQARAVDLMASEYRPVAKFGFVWPVFRELPVEDDEFPVLCGKAGSYVADLATYPIEQALPNGVGDFLTAPMGTILESLTSVGSSWFCGGEGEKPQIRPEDLIVDGNAPEKLFPRAPGQEECERGDDDACRRADAYLQSAIPDRRTGECHGRPECEDFVARARHECNAEGFETYRFQARGYHVTYRRARGIGGGAIVRSAPSPVSSGLRCDEMRTRDVSPRLQESRSRPCGVGWTPWNARSGEPLCIPDDLPNEPPRILSSGETYVLCFDAIAESLGCAKKVETTIEEPEPFEGFEDDGGCRKVSQRIQEGVHLGEERFQLRALVVGGELPARGEGGLGLATWGRSEDEGDAGNSLDAAADEALAMWMKLVRPLRRVQIAQAEFYFHEEGADRDRDAWMWRMRWRARMRHVRLNEIASGDSLVAGSLEEACGKGPFAAACSEVPLSDFLTDLLRNPLVH